jgi:hypothetical protein
MNDNGSEREFFVTGAKTDLDADDAIAQFRHMVQDKIATSAGAWKKSTGRAI